MNGYLLTLIILSLIATGFLLQRRAKIRKRRQAIEQARREAEQGLVPCFTCGMKVPRDSALEKKGRYFCGVKKAQREAGSDRETAR